MQRNSIICIVFFFKDAMIVRKKSYSICIMNCDKGGHMGSKRFEVREQQQISGGIIKIIVDTKTGVNYLVTSGMGVSGMTPLLDSNGKAVITR